MRIIWIDGTFGVGKSTVSRELKKNIPGSVVLEFDELQNKYYPKNFSDLYGDRFPEARTYLVDALVKEIKEYSKKEPNVTIIIPIAIITDYCNQQLIEGLNGYLSYHFILFTSDEILLKRIRAQKNRDIDLAVMYMNQANEYLNAHYRDATWIDTSTQSTIEVAKLINDEIQC